jgi:hypothetical protein
LARAIGLLTTSGTRRFGRKPVGARGDRRTHAGPHEPLAEQGRAALLGVSNGLHRLAGEHPMCASERYNLSTNGACQLERTENFTSKVPAHALHKFEVESLAPRHGFEPRLGQAMENL